MSQPSRIEKLIHSNIEIVERVERRERQVRTGPEVFSDAIAGFCGSMTFVWLHVLWFAGWLAVNTLPGVPRNLQFDRAPFGILTLVVSLEAIFLSTFILISQNRQQRTADLRNHMDLQINILAEQEVTKIIRMLKTIMEKQGIDVDEAMEEMSEEVNTGELADELTEAAAKRGKSRHDQGD